MAKLGQFLNNTLTKVDEQEFGGVPRTYLGMSGLGRECSAELWLNFHWATHSYDTAKKDRTFGIGHEFEKIIIAQLKAAGMEVFKVIDGVEIEMFGFRDEEQEEFIGFAGHAKGHNDGRIRNVPEAPKTDHNLEIKTAKESSYKKYFKGGVKKANPVYYAQCQRYMRATGLTRTLFIVLNKNTSELYIERIKADASFQNDLIRKETSIIMSHEVATRAFEAGHFMCGPKWCQQAPVCRGLVNPLETCRTCEHGDIEGDGVWSCARQKGKHLTTQDQWNGCNRYQLGWEFVSTGDTQGKPEVIFKSK